MDRYLTLLLAHILADFPLQAGVIYTWKISSRRGLALHVAIHMVVMLVLFESPGDWWLGLLALGIAHYLIDWWKLNTPIKPQSLGFIIDQALHAVSLVPIAVYFPGMHSRIPDEFILSDFLIALISPLLMLLWTMALDVPEPERPNPVHVLVSWAKRRLLLISQLMGFALILVFFWQAYLR